MIRIGDRVTLGATTETLVVIAIDGPDAWLRDDAGNKLTMRIEDLAPA